LTAIQNFDNLEKGLNEIRRVGKHYILTFLKKSPKRDTIEELIQKKFNVIKKIEEDKDLIYFCK
jgi:ubiquinone/menaquinone biosynthesis C-methylase UbiE